MQPETKVPTAVCPECGGLLKPVAFKTVKHLLNYPLSRALGSGDFQYCPDRQCDVIYVGSTPESEEAEVVFYRKDIKERANLSAEPDQQFACFCFGYTVAEIRADADAEGMVPRAIASEVRAGNCACEVLNPSGH